MLHCFHVCLPCLRAQRMNLALDCSPFCQLLFPLGLARNSPARPSGELRSGKSSVRLLVAAWRPLMTSKGLLQAGSPVRPSCLEVPPMSIALVWASPPSGLLPCLGQRSFQSVSIMEHVVFTKCSGHRTHIHI